jgi:hypothetical protein
MPELVWSLGKVHRILELDLTKLFRWFEAKKKAVLKHDNEMDQKKSDIHEAFRRRLVVVRAFLEFCTGGRLPR